MGIRAAIFFRCLFPDFLVVMPKFAHKPFTLSGIRFMLPCYVSHVTNKNNVTTTNSLPLPSLNTETQLVKSGRLYAHLVALLCIDKERERHSDEIRRKFKKVETKRP